MDLALKELIAGVPLAMSGVPSEWTGMLALIAVGSVLVWLFGMVCLGGRDGKVVAGPEWLAVGLLVGLQALLFQL